ncbi:MAG TPA: class I SAM-dependent methyltransferase [Actinomycetaceae bacterium]|nr:class I SAM-dependent methyltransferase [Actinomycetaceae bacterium]
MTENHFDSKAGRWDDHTRRARAAAVAVAIGEQVPLAHVRDLFEFGGGTGLLSLALRPRPPRVLLTDTSNGMLEIVRAKIAAEGLTGWQASPLDITAAEVPESLTAEFDLVASMLALHHVRDVPTLLGRFTGLLRPGGWVALTDLDDDDGHFHHPDTHRHHDGFSRAALAEWLTDAGFAGIHFSTPYVQTKVIDGVERDFPLFLAVAQTAGGPGAD